MKKGLVLLAGLLLSAALVAQQPEPRKWMTFARISISHSGWNSAVAGAYRLKRFSFYAGPSFTLNRGYSEKGPWGFIVGANYRIAENKHLGSLVNLDYQMHRFHSSDFINEWMLSYGFILKISQRFDLVHQMGFGLYLESVENPHLADRESFWGYNGMMALSGRFSF